MLRHFYATTDKADCFKTVCESSRPHHNNEINDLLNRLITDENAIIDVTNQDETEISNSAFELRCVKKIELQYAKITPTITPRRDWLMATYRRRGESWRVEVSRNGKRLSASYPTKAQCVAWAAQKETELAAGKSGIVTKYTVKDLLERYARDVSPTKRGKRWEIIRIDKIIRENLAGIADRRLVSVTPSDFAAWRDARLRHVTPPSVRREMQIFSHAFNVAAKEWQWVSSSPVKDVRRPDKGQPRDRRISDAEIEALLHTMGWDKQTPPVTATARVAAAMLFAIETAMRAGEICGLRWQDVDTDKRVAVLHQTKNGTVRRVPLSSESLRLLALMPRDGDQVFALTTAILDAVFRRARERALITDLHFHDTRHEAITRLAKKISVLDLARMVGHKDLRQLQVYYNESAEDIAAKIG